MAQMMFSALPQRKYEWCIYDPGAPNTYQTINKNKELVVIDLLLTEHKGLCAMLCHAMPYRAVPCHAVP